MLRHQLRSAIRAISRQSQSGLPRSSTLPAHSHKAIYTASSQLLKALKTPPAVASFHTLQSKPAARRSTTASHSHHGPHAHIPLQHQQLINRAIDESLQTFQRQQQAGHRRYSTASYSSKAKTSASYSKSDDALRAMPLPTLREQMQYVLYSIYEQVIASPLLNSKKHTSNTTNTNKQSPTEAAKEANRRRQEQGGAAVDKPADGSPDSQSYDASQSHLTPEEKQALEPTLQAIKSAYDKAKKEAEEQSQTTEDGKDKKYETRSKVPGSTPDPQTAKQKGDGSSSPVPPNMSLGGWVVLALILAYVLTDLGGGLQFGDEITWQDFKMRFLELGKVHHLEVTPDKRVYVYLRSDSGDIDRSSASQYFFNVGSIETFERQLEEAQQDLDIDARDFLPVKYRKESQYGPLLSTILQYALIFGIFYYISRQMMGALGGGAGGKGGGGMGGIFRIGKSNATVVQPGEMTKVTFADVAGLDEAKVEVMEFVKFLKAPEKFTKLGAKVPKGALLVGPPGTGKTLLAKAMAGEASVPFFSISGSDFIEMFVGVGPSRVRDLFAEARKSAPCMIFIDEIDAVGRERGKGKFAGGNDERENTLNQMLVEMDGFNEREGVVVLAGTNRADILDKALLRAGRFDRQISVDKPDLNGRRQIFLVHLKNIRTSHNKDDLSNRLAALTPGMVGADIANLCNEAAIIAARADKDEVELVDFESAADRILGGIEKKNNGMSALERKLVAYHEAGHAVAGWFLEHADPLLKVTIVPRGNGALGFAQYLPNELHLYQQDQLSDMMVMTLAGRASEQVFFKKISTGASDDLQKVSRIAMAQVGLYGMSARLGHVAYSRPDEEQFTKPYSEATAQAIDEEVRAMVDTAFKRSVAILELHKDKVEALAERLLQVETVNHDVLVEILGPRPYQTESYKRWSDSLNSHKEDNLRRAERKKEQELKEKETSEESSHSGEPAVQL